MSTAAASSVSNTRDVNFPVYSGSEILAFYVAEMPPGIRIYTYVNGVNITAFTGPATSSATLGQEVTTDQTGYASGYLYIPSTEGQYKFPSGEIRLTFGDSPNGISDCKYVSETTLMNHGLSLVDTEQGGTVSLRQTEKFRTDNAGSSGDKNTTLKRLDPLTQTFIVDEVKHPLGVVITGIGLFITKKDTTLPIGVELRPMDGGIPSTTEYFSGTSVFIPASKVELYTQSNPKPTNFTFQHPVYLKPGEYAFSVLTKSAKYELFCSGKASATTAAARRGNIFSESSVTVTPAFGAIEQGRLLNFAPSPLQAALLSQQKQLEAKYISAYPGKLFKAQNTGAWFADLNQDITFFIRKAKFQTGTITFEMNSPDLSQIDYNRLRFLTTDVALGDTAYATYKIRTTNASTARDRTDFRTINPGDILDMQGRQSVKDKEDIKLQVSLTSKSADVSPILDKQLIKSQIFRNNVDEYNQAVSASELSPYGGSAKARYVSKIVELQEGFDSTGLEVKIDVNRKIGTDIEVFARVQSRDDKAFTAGIKSRPWVRLPLVSPTVKSYAGTDDNKFTTETYKLLEPSLSYTVSANVQSNVAVSSSYEDFSQYQVKVVFYANNPVFLPKIKKLVATSVL